MSRTGLAGDRGAGGTPEVPLLTVVDLFCGAGGLSEGFRQAGFRVTAGSDNDPDAVATYAANFPGALALCGDIRDPGVRERLNTAAAGADILVGGPPCQAFSQVRNHSRLIDDPRNSLYREFVASVAAARPAAFLMANVPGMAQMGVKDQVLEDLSIGGDYRVHAQLADAADFGVPQTRKRLLFLGVRTDLGVAPPCSPGVARPRRCSSSGSPAPPTPRQPAAGTRSPPAPTRPGSCSGCACRTPATTASSPSRRPSATLAACPPAAAGRPSPRASCPRLHRRTSGGCAPGTATT